MLPYTVRDSTAPGTGETAGAQDRYTNEKRHHVGAVVLCAVGLGFKNVYHILHEV